MQESVEVAAETPLLVSLRLLLGGPPGDVSAGRALLTNSGRSCKITPEKWSLEGKPAQCKRP